jgi:hypothetical protein
MGKIHQSATMTPGQREATETILFSPENNSNM